MGNFTPTGNTPYDLQKIVQSLYNGVPEVGIAVPGVNPTYGRQTITATGAAVTLNPDPTLGQILEVTQGTTAQTLTIAVPVVRKVGFFTLRFIHFADAVAWTLTWNAVYKRAGGAFANTNTSGATDDITFYDDGTTCWEVGRAVALA